MAKFNQSILVGRLAEDPKLAPESLGRSAATITVVVNDHYRDGDGRLVRTKDSFRVRLYGWAAGYAAETLGKDSLVMVSGRLRTEKWRDKDTGTWKYAVVVVVDDSDGLQGLADPGHDVYDGLEDEAQQPHGNRPHVEAGSVQKSEMKIQTPSACVSDAAHLDAGSEEFEKLHGLQPIPF